MSSISSLELSKLLANVFNVTKLIPPYYQDKNIVTDALKNNMKRPDKNFLQAICACPERNGNLSFNLSESICTRCLLKFKKYNGIPVIFSRKNFLFRDSDYTEEYSSGHLEKHSATVKQKMTHLLKKYMPSKSINLARHKIFSELAERYSSQPLSLLVVGCGSQAKKLQDFFGNSNITFLCYGVAMGAV
jgi:uncharacterized protein YbaR (Trm112 family)